jgi:hypothetical protein
MLQHSDEATTSIIHEVVVVFRTQHFFSKKDLHFGAIYDCFRRARGLVVDPINRAHSTMPLNQRMNQSPMHSLTRPVHVVFKNNSQLSGASLSTETSCCGAWFEMCVVLAVNKLDLSNIYMILRSSTLD